MHRVALGVVDFSRSLSRSRPLTIFTLCSQWASVLSRVALEQERMLPVLMDLMRTDRDLELRSLTGFLRNLSRHAKDKNDMGKSGLAPRRLHTLPG